MHGRGKSAEASGDRTRVVALPGAEQRARDDLSLVEELRSEIAGLRRELRLLRMANAELERIAVRDPLTPLYNRRFFLTALTERLARAKRYDAKAAVLFIDINKMKFINDQFGHGAGDFALVHAAQLVRTSIRSTDVAARIGGDEFAVILEEVDEERALAKAVQLEEVIAATPCTYGDDVLPVSASIGFTMLQPDDSEDSLIERADANMYARKRAWHGSTATRGAGGSAAA